MTIMNIINACATELAKNATTDPMLALSAFPKSKSCTNSTMSTAIKGTMIIPNGGMTKHPTITPINRILTQFRTAKAIYKVFIH